MIYKLNKFRVIYRSPEGWKVSPAKVVEFNKGGATTAEAEDGGKGAIDWDTAFLVQFAGSFDKAGSEIYHTDILEDESGERFEVIAVGSGYGIVSANETFEYLTDVIAKKLTIVSNAITDEDTSMPSNVEEVFARGKKPEMEVSIEEPKPKVYTLKKPAA